MSTDQQEKYCPRSQWATLATAASAVGLFAGANWGLAALVGDTHNAGFVRRLVNHVVSVFTLPMQALNITVWNAVEVWAVHPQLCPAHRSWTSIITLCPIFIQVPEHAGDIASQLEQQPQYERVTDIEALKKLNPIGPALMSSLFTSHEDAFVNAADPQIPANQDHQHHHQRIYLRIASPLGFQFDNAKERYALLASGLVPQRSELLADCLQARSLFQSVVIILQAIGYLMSMLERMLQGLAVSPVEAIMSYLCILAVIQLLIESKYGCGKFQRPLLLSFDHQQLSSLVNAPRIDLHSLYFRRKQRYLLSMYVLLASAVLIGYPSSKYFTPYLSAGYYLCASPGLLFFLAYIVSTASRNLFQAVSRFLFVCTLVTAVAANLRDWELFRTPAQHSFAQIFPHFTT